MPDSLTNGPFEIYLAWSDKRLFVGPNETALKVMLDAGVPIEPGCEFGSCGYCVMPYVEGDVIHNDACLEQDQRRRYFCPCVSRAATQIVLAL